MSMRHPKRSIERQMVTFVLLGVVGAFCLSATQMGAQARFLPLAVGLPTLALLLAQTVMDMRDRKQPPKTAVALGAVLLPSCALLAGIYVLGFLVAIPIFVAAEWKRAGVGWAAATAIGVSAGAFLVGLFYLLPQLAPPGEFLWNWLS